MGFFSDLSLFRCPRAWIGSSSQAGGMLDRTHVPNTHPWIGPRWRSNIIDRHTVSAPRNVRFRLAASRAVMAVFTYWGAGK
jgi:hypothetical protein